MSEMGQLEHEIRQIVADTLGLDEDEVRSESRFFQDLGGESIDLLDLAFTCEREYGVRVEFQQMLSPRKLEPDAEGRLTPQAREWLAETYPFIGVERLPADAKPDDLRELFTVRVITEVVRQTRDGTLPDVAMSS